MFIILAMVAGRFAWRICFFGAGIKLESDLRSRMFDRCKDLSQEYYQVNKVGNLMSYFTIDLETIQECFGDGALMLCDAILLGGLAIIRNLNGHQNGAGGLFHLVKSLHGGGQLGGLCNPGVMAGVHIVNFNTIQ